MLGAVPYGFVPLSLLENIVNRTGPEVVKIFMLSSGKHEILNAHKYKNIKNFSFFTGSDKPRMLFSCT